MSKTEPRKRKPAARRTDIVIALLEDRLEMIDTDSALMHKAKMLELFDELKRSLGKKDESETE